MPHLSEANAPQKERVGLARTLGPGAIIFMGIGCLLGGGIFTLLGPAAGLAGPGLFIAMLLGAAVAFLNLQMYLALGTTFPGAGGGYLWVRKGMGNFQGFLAGWFSWFASVAACGVYALSLAYYANEFFGMIGFDFGLSRGITEKIIAVLLILAFGWLNWRGTKSMGVVGVYVTGGLLTVLVLFIVSGFLHMGASPRPFTNFTPLLPHGLFGVLAAAAFYYIAFEGSEIQVQAGEETRDPERNLKIGLIVSWAVVSALYLLISLVIVGATDAPAGGVWEVLGGFGEGAIVRAAEHFMPLGGLLMTFAGLLANLAALNATIFSSSHVSFALARDSNIWSGLSRIHGRNFTPHLAVAVSAALVIAMVVALPLFDVASAASLLFVLLFLQLNVAGIAIHFKFPDTKWKYRVPLFPVLPLAAIAVYAVLAVVMLKTNLTAWLVTVFWLLLGLVNYFAYAMAKGRERFENEIVYEEAVRLGPKRGKRILMPIGPTLSNDEIRQRLEMALVLASRLGGEIVTVKIHEVPQPLMLLDGAKMEHDRQIFERIKEWVIEFNQRIPGRADDISFHNLIMVARDVSEAILEVVRMEECDLLLLSWKGYTRAKGKIFGSTVDRILREAHCDLLVHKDFAPPKRMILAANPKAKNPNLIPIGSVFKAVADHYGAETELYCAVGSEVPVYFKTDATPVLKELGLTEGDFGLIRFVSAKSIAKALIDEAEAVKADMVMVGAAKPKFLKDIRFGSIPESLAKHLGQGKSLFIFRGHKGMGEAILERMKGWIASLKPKA